MRTGEHPYTGEVVIQGNRIKQIIPRLVAQREQPDAGRRRDRD